MSTPHLLAEKRMKITGLYSRDSEKLEVVLTQKPKVWMEMRKQCETNAETDRAWEASELGIEEMKLRLRLKRYEKQLSALRSMLDVKAQEARNVI